jgi:hypothetical protein
MPPLWTKDGGAIAGRSRRPISIREMWALQQYYVQSL